MQATVRKVVRERAADRCEYCRLSQAHAPAVQFHVEHIRARQHGGTDDLTNLCLACVQCNWFKGPNLSGHDPESDSLVPLFHPRKQVWSEHFKVVQGRVIGLTAVGRAPVELLRMNNDDRVELRNCFGDQAFND